MNKDTLTRLIDSVYELEGLLQLALRSETPVDGLKEATKKKLTEILEELGKEDKEEADSETQIIPETREYAETNETRKTVEIRDTAGGHDDADAGETAGEIDNSVIVVEERDAIDVTEPSGSAPVRSFVGVPLVLSVNDRFRYTRTMFNGNSSRLEAALTAVASLENEKDIRQFLAAESGLDAYGDPEIESFIELLDARLK